MPKDILYLGKAKTHLVKNICQSFRVISLAGRIKDVGTLFPHSRGMEPQKKQ